MSAAASKRESRSYTIILAATIGILLLGAGYCVQNLLWLAEPEYQGRSVSAWLREFSQTSGKVSVSMGTSPGTRATGTPVLRVSRPNTGRGSNSTWDALNALRAIGAPGAPHLAAALGKRDGLGHNEYARIYPKLPLVLRSVFPAPSPDAVFIRRAAIQALWALGDEAKAAYPVLIAASHDSDLYVRRVTIGLLNQLSPKHPEVSAALNRLITPGLSNTEVIRLVECFHLNGPTAVRALQAALNDRDPNLRQYAMLQFALMPAGTEYLLPAMLAALKHADAAVRVRACDMLGGMRGHATRSVPALEEALHDEARPVRIAAIEALARYGPAAKPALPRLKEMEKADDPTERFAAQQAVRRIEAEAAARTN